MRYNIKHIIIILTFYICAGNNISYSKNDDFDLERNINIGNYQEVIDYIGSDFHSSNAKTAALLRAYYEQASLYSIYFDYSVDALKEYVKFRSEGDVVEPNINNYYKGMIYSYLGYNDKLNEYLQIYLNNANSNSDYRIIAGDVLNNNTSPIEAISGWLKRDYEIYSLDCDRFNDSWLERCKVIKKLSDLTDISPTGTPGIKTDISIDNYDINEFATITYSDPIDLYLFSTFRYRQFYDIGINIDYISNQIELIEAAYESNRYDKILELTEQNNSSKHSIYQAAVKYTSKNNNDKYLNTIIQGIESDDNSVSALAAWLLTDIGLGHEYKNEILNLIDKPSLDLDDAILISRALIAINEYENVIELLEYHYDRSDHNDIEVLNNKKLALLSHAKFKKGRRYYSESISHLVALATRNEPMRPFLNILQELVMPECPECGIVR